MTATGSLPTGLPGRLLALGLTLLLLAAAWFATVQPVIDWYADRAANLDQRVRLARRMTEMTASVPVAANRAADPQAPATLPGSSDAVAGADLQQRVQEMAAQAGATVTSTETLPAAAAGAYRRIGLHLSVNATWPVLVALLQAVGQASPRMLIDDFQVRGPRLVVRPSEPPLEVSFTLFGFRAGGTP